MPPTYSSITRAPIETDSQKYVRERMEAAISILERIIGQDVEDELDREMERRENLAYHRGQNLMMAQRAIEAIRSANCNLEEMDFSVFTTKREIYRTRYGMLMSGIEEVLRKFWTGEQA